jgi:NADH-quinone oxidoreductase subunit C
MTLTLDNTEIAQKLMEQFPDSIVSTDKTAILVNSVALFKVAQFLKNTPGLDFDYLADLTAVDYTDYFEVVYHLMSLERNHSVTIKTRSYDRENPVVPSVVSLWRTADYQEREAYDLMGIVFEGHPNLKRLFLWEGFEGYPLRRDYL